jgi:hypothetical protein
MDCRVVPVRPVELAADPESNEVIHTVIFGAVLVRRDEAKGGEPLTIDDDPEHIAPVWVSEYKKARNGGIIEVPRLLRLIRASGTKEQIVEFFSERLADVADMFSKAIVEEESRDRRVAYNDPGQTQFQQPKEA